MESIRSMSTIPVSCESFNFKGFAHLIQKFFDEQDCSDYSRDFSGAKTSASRARAITAHPLLLPDQLVGALLDLGTLDWRELGEGTSDGTDGHRDHARILERFGEVGSDCLLAVEVLGSIERF